MKQRPAQKYKSLLKQPSSDHSLERKGEALQLTKTYQTMIEQSTKKQKPQDHSKERSKSRKKSAHKQRAQPYKTSYNQKPSEDEAHKSF